MSAFTVPGKLVVRVWEGQVSTAKSDKGSSTRFSYSSRRILGDEITCKVEFDGHTAYCTTAGQKDADKNCLVFPESDKDAILDVFEYHGAIPITITLYLKRCFPKTRFSEQRNRISRMVFRARSGLSASKQVGMTKLRLRETVPGHYRTLARLAADAFENPALHASVKSAFGTAAQWWGASSPSPPTHWKQYWPSMTIPLSCGGSLKLGILFVPFVSPERSIAGYTELHKAAFMGDAKLVSTLLLPRSGSSGALAARTRDSLQATPQDIAAMRGHYEVALQIFSDLSSTHPITVSNQTFTASRRKTSLHYAVEGGNVALVSFLACYFGSRGDMVSVANHSNVTVEDSSYTFQLHHTLLNPPSQERVRLLDVTDENGCSALMLACAKRDMSEAVARLVEMGANMSIANKQGDTALIIACRMGHFENALALLKTVNQMSFNVSPSNAAPPDSKASMARPNKANFAGERALDRACVFGPCREVIRALLDACAVPALRSHDGKTALHYAAQAGFRENCEEIISWLDRERAKMASTKSLSEYVGSAIGQSLYLVLIRDAHGKFASDYAFEAGHAELGEWLKHIEMRDAQLFKSFSGAKTEEEFGLDEGGEYELGTGN